MAESNKTQKARGFASMDPERQRQIASQGGKAAHEKGTAHEFTSEEAREAGRKGGQASGIARAQMKNKQANSGTSDQSSEEQNLANEQKRAS